MAKQIPSLQSTNTLGTDDQMILRQGNFDRRISAELMATLSWAKRGGFTHLGEHSLGLTFPDTESFSTYQGRVYFVKSLVALPHISSETDPRLDDNLYHKDEASSSSIIANDSTTTRQLSARFADVVNVKDYGAVGDGVTDDTLAIQAAIDYVSSANPLLARTLYIPSGLYMITEELNCWGYCTIKGAGRTKTQIKAMAPFTGNTMIAWYDQGFASAYRYNFSGFNLNGDSLVEAIISSKTANEWSNHEFFDMGFENATLYQIRITTGAFANRFINCYFSGPALSGAIICAGLAYMWQFSQCSFTNFGTAQGLGTVDVSSAINWSFVQCRMESEGDIDSVWFHGKNGSQATFTDCYVERANGVFVREISSKNRISIIGCRFVLEAGYKFDSDGVITMMNNYFFNGTGTRKGTAAFCLIGENGTGHVTGKEVKTYTGTISETQKIVTYPEKDAPSTINPNVVLAEFTRSSTPTPGTDSFATTTAEVTVNIGVFITGGFRAYHSGKYLVNLMALAQANINTDITEIASVTTAGRTFTLTSRNTSAMGIELVANFDADGTTYENSAMQVKIDFIATNETDGEFIIIPT